MFDAIPQEDTKIALQSSPIPEDQPTTDIEHLKNSITKLEDKRNTLCRQNSPDKEELDAMHAKLKQLKRDINSLYQTKANLHSSSTKQEAIIEAGDLEKELEQLKSNNYLHSQQVFALKHELVEQQQAFKNALHNSDAPAHKETVEERELRKRRDRLREAKLAAFDEVQERIELIGLELKVQSNQFKQIVRENDALFLPLKGKLVGLPGKEVAIGSAAGKDRKPKRVAVCSVQPPKQSSASTIKKTVKTFSRKEKPNEPQFYTEWKDCAESSRVRSKILVELLRDQSNCKEYVAKHFKQLLSMLQEAFSNSDPTLYDAATVCLSRLLKVAKLELADFSSLHCECRAIRGLGGQRDGETEEFVAERHLAAANALVHASSLELNWTSDMTIELDDIDGLSTLSFYIENYEDFGEMAVKAVEVLIWFASYKENHYLIKGADIFDTIMSEACQARLLKLKQLIAECLILFTKTSTLRTELKEDARLKDLLVEIDSEYIDATYKESLLLFFLNLSEETSFNKLLYDYGILDISLNLLRSIESDVFTIYGLRITSNIIHSNCPTKIFQRLVPPLLKILNGSKNSNIIIQALNTLLVILESSAGKLSHEYSKILPPVLILIRSVEDDIICQALRVLGILLSSGEHLVAQAVTQGDPIKVCVLLYCTHESPSMTAASKVLLSIFARSKYAEDIGRVGKAAVVEKLLARVGEEKEKKEALEVLECLVECERNREYVGCVKGARKFLCAIVEMLHAPVSAIEL